MTLRSLLGLLGLVLVSCFAGSPQNPQRSAADNASSGLLGTAWRLEDLAGARAVDGVEATLEFPKDGTAQGDTSCNRFFGGVKISGKSISFSSFATTRRGCPGAVDMQERSYLNALENAEWFALDGRALFIYSKGMDKPLRFIRTKP